MQSAQRDEEEPANQTPAVTMQSAQRDEEEPANQPGR
jgi:diglucosylglycerate octanoyltransferase